MVIEIDETKDVELTRYFSKVDIPARSYVAKQLILFALTRAADQPVAPLLLGVSQGKVLQVENEPEVQFEYGSESSRSIPQETPQFKPKPAIQQKKPEERKIVTLSEEERLEVLNKKLDNF